MRILVTMGRRYGYKLIKDRPTEYYIVDHGAVGEFFVALEQYLPEGDLTIIHGCAPGEDMLVARFCHKWRHVSEERYPADWETYGKAAGPKRNLKMLEEGKPDLCLAFPGGSGTNHMVKQCLKAGVLVERIS